MEARLAETEFDAAASRGTHLRSLLPGTLSLGPASRVGSEVHAGEPGE